MGEVAFSNYQELLSMEQTDLITNLEAFECPICEDVYYPGDGVILKTCLHHFCRYESNHVFHLIGFSYNRFDLC